VKIQPQRVVTPGKQTTNKLLIKYYSGDQFKKNEMGGAYSTYGGEWRYIQGFGGEP
jgi:hypothetical protein